MTVRDSTEEVSWHSLNVQDVLLRQQASADGLDSEEAARRLGVYGPNELQVLERASPWRTLAAQFKNVLVAILLVATLLSGLLGHGLEAVVIAIIVLFAVILGFVQEYRAERALEALREMAAPLGHVLRDGREAALRRARSCPGTSCCCDRATACRRTPGWWWR